MKRLLIFPILLCFSLPGLAAVTEDDLLQIRQQLNSLLDRVESLEAENAKLRQTANSTPSISASNKTQKSWTDGLKITGNLRTRYESIDIQGADTRERSRIRARVAITAKPSDNVEVGIGIASGSDDPLSTNQTLGGGASTKDVGLDLAYFKWHAKPGLTLVGGKMKNIWYRAGGHGLVWDGDYRPEGLALTYKGDRFFLNGGAQFIESDTRKSNARLSYGMQAGINTELAAGKLTAGVSYFVLGAQGEATYYDDDFFGNSSVCTGSHCTYLNDYEEIELFTQLSTSVGELPLSIFADYVQNQDASDMDTAWAAGFKIGEARVEDSWELAYVYQDLEADSVFGLWTDSDFAGGGTDSRGHSLKGAWAVTDTWKIGFTYFNAERNIDLGVEEDYRRLMLDWAFKF